MVAVYICLQCFKKTAFFFLFLRAHISKYLIKKIIKNSLLQIIKILFFFIIYKVIQFENLVYSMALSKCYC